MVSINIVSPKISILLVLLVACTLIVLNSIIFFTSSIISYMSYDNYFIVLRDIIGATKTTVFYIMLSITILIGSLIILCRVFSRLGALMGLARGILWFSVYMVIMAYVGLLVKSTNEFNGYEIAVSTTWFVVNIVILIYISSIPPIAITLTRYSQDKGAENISNNNVFLENNDILYVKVYGDKDRLEILSEPQNMLEMNEPHKYFKYWLYEFIPISEGKVKLSFLDKKKSHVYTIYNVYIRNLTLRKYFLEIFINDNKVSEVEVSVEETKTLSKALEPFIEATLGRFSIPRGRVYSITYTDAENKVLNPDTRIRDLVLSDNKTLRVYITVTEEYKDLMLMLGTKSIEELWDLIIRRIAVMRMKIEEITKKILAVTKEIEIVIDNWW